jgi:hypothetical protein
MAALISLKVFFLSSSHLNSTSLRIIFCKGLIISAKLGVNFLTKLICLKKVCMDFFLWGSRSWDMALILSGSM